MIKGKKKKKKIGERKRLWSSFLNVLFTRRCTRTKVGCSPAVSPNIKSEYASQKRVLKRRSEEEGDPATLDIHSRHPTDYFCRMLLFTPWLLLEAERVARVNIFRGTFSRWS